MVLPREGEFLVRMRTDESRDDPEVEYPVFIVQTVEYHCQKAEPGIPATVHLFLEIADDGEDDDEEDGELLPEFPPPGRAEPRPPLDDQELTGEAERLHAYLAGVPAC